MKKALLITTVSGFVPQFEMNNVRILQEMGYEVHYASNFHYPHYGSDNCRLEGSNLICHQVDFVRSPFRLWKNKRAYQQLCVILRENLFEVIHCHTPMGGVLGRLVAERDRRKRKLEKDFRKVFYTVHGFHFYCGAPWRNWLFYYPIERWFAHYTDVLITINREDYQRAKKFHLRKIKGIAGRVEKINGVGLQLSRYQKYIGSVQWREEKRKEFGISKNACVFISVGELTKRKNHQVVVKAFALLKKECKKEHIQYWICGEGKERSKLLRQIRYSGLTEVVHLLGYRTDIEELLAISDCFLFPSKQEGLPVALMEAKAMGLPCICSDIRGNRELAESKELVGGTGSKAYQKKIKEFLIQRRTQHMPKRIAGQVWNRAEDYSATQVMQQMKRIYTENLRKHS